MKKAPGSGRAAGGPSGVSPQTHIIIIKSGLRQPRMFYGLPIIRLRVRALFVQKLPLPKMRLGIAGALPIASDRTLRPAVK
jgi:hypothetical protein